MRFHRLHEHLADAPYTFPVFDPLHEADAKDQRRVAIHLLKNSQKFFVGYDQLLPRGIFANGKELPPLPFMECAIEYEVGPGMSTILLCMDHVSIVDVLVYGVGPQVTPSRWLGSFTVSRETGFFEGNPNFPLWSVMANKPPEGCAPHDYFRSVSRRFFSFLSALSCVNVERAESVPPARLNKKRAASGKPPIYSYWTLEIRSGSDARGEALGGHHASPRIHLRRGHIKKRKTGNFWWRPCAVGDRKRGVVMKDYELKGAK